MVKRKVIRKATLDDCFELARIHVKSWQQAYESLVPKSYLDGLSVEKRAKTWETVIKQETRTVLLDVPDQSVAGFCANGPYGDEDGSDDWGTIGAIYYLREFWGKGFAGVLLKESLRDLTERGYPVVALWVLAGNLRAASFYEKHGFTRDGMTKSEDRGYFSLDEIRMVRR